MAMANNSNDQALAVPWGPLHMDSGIVEDGPVLI